MDDLIVIIPCDICDYPLESTTPELVVMEAEAVAQHGDVELVALCHVCRDKMQRWFGSPEDPI